MWEAVKDGEVEPKPGRRGTDERLRCSSCRSSHAGATTAALNISSCVLISNCHQPSQEQGAAGPRRIYSNYATAAVPRRFAELDGHPCRRGLDSFAPPLPHPTPSTFSFLGVHTRTHSVAQENRLSCKLANVRSTQGLIFGRKEPPLHTHTHTPPRGGLLPAATLNMQTSRCVLCFHVCLVVRGARS